MAAWACQFTPRVSLEPPQEVLMEVEGSLRYFGGRWKFLARLRAGLTRLGFEARVAEAPAARAALWKAREERPGSCRPRTGSRCVRPGFRTGRLPAAVRVRVREG